MHLFTFEFWRYVLRGPRYRQLLPREPMPYFRAAWCRFRGHPNGIIYYTGPMATEPDNRCKDCYEEL